MDLPPGAPLQRAPNMAELAEGFRMQTCRYGCDLKEAGMGFGTATCTQEGRTRRLRAGESACARLRRLLAAYLNGRE